MTDVKCSHRNAQRWTARVKSTLVQKKLSQGSYSPFPDKAEGLQTGAVCESTYQVGKALSPLSVQANNSQTADRRALLRGMEADPEKGPDPTDGVGTPWEGESAAATHVDEPSPAQIYTENSMRLSSKFSI